MELVGRILTINVISDKSVQIVIKKQMDGKVVPIAISVFGFWKQKMDEMKLLKNEKIGGKVYIKSNLYKGKYYTDIYFKEIERIQPKPKNEFVAPNTTTEQNLFDDTDNNMLNGIGYIVDEETGEIRL